MTIRSSSNLNGYPLSAGSTTITPKHVAACIPTLSRLKRAHRHVNDKNRFPHPLGARIRRYKYHLAEFGIEIQVSRQRMGNPAGQGHALSVKARMWVYQWIVTLELALLTTLMNI